MEKSKPQAVSHSTDMNAQPADIDLLINLPLESEFRVEVARQLELSRQQAVDASLALFQLANIYEIQDCLGPTEARLLLSDIVNAIRKSLPASILACRCKNHEFALLLQDDCNDQAAAILANVQSLLESTVSSVIPPEISLRCEYGLTAIDPDIPSVDALFARARLGLRGRHAGASPTASGDSSERRRTMLHIERLLQQDALVLSYQPVVSFDRTTLNQQALDQEALGHTTGAQYEVRADFRNSEGNMPTRLVFEHAAQEAMGERIDRFVIEKAMGTLSAMDSSTVFILNVSLDSIINHEFLGWLSGLLKRFEIKSEQLVLQISETDVLVAQHHLHQFSKSLHKMRIKLGLCHFGCAASAFKYLPLLKLLYARLDASLLENLLLPGDSRKHLEQISSSLQSHGIRPMAGMLEEINLLPILWEIGIRDFQGNCLQPASPKPAFEFPVERTLG